MKIPIELVSHDLLNTVDTGGRYGLLTFEKRFGASGYCNDNESTKKYRKIKGIRIKDRIVTQTSKSYILKEM